MQTADLIESMEAALLAGPSDAESMALTALAARRQCRRSTCCVVVQLVLLVLLVVLALPFALMLVVLIKVCVCVPLPASWPLAVRSKLRPPKRGSVDGWPAGHAPGNGERRPCATPDGTDWEQLHMGIRWLAGGYHAARPTVVYVHGWEPGTTARGFHETFNWKRNTLFPEQGETAEELPDVDAAALWAARGWNVGIFYWNQLADDTLPEAERKIHSACGEVGMRWQRRAPDGGTSAVAVAEGEMPCIAECLVEALAPLWQACGGRSGGGSALQLRLIGHSLGAQLVIEASRRLLERYPPAAATTATTVGAAAAADVAAASVGAATAAPLRLALLEPFFTTGRKPWLGGATGVERADESLTLLRRALPQLPIECYRTSVLGDPPLCVACLPMLGARSRVLHRHCAFSYVAPPQLHALSFRSRHIAAFSLYQLSIAASALDAAGERQWAGAMHPGASDDDILARMRPVDGVASTATVASGVQEDKDESTREPRI